MIVSLFVCFGACDQKPPASADAPASNRVAGSTTSARSGGILSAPADYVKGTVDNIDRAKAAKALYEKTEKEQLKTLDQLGSDGN